MMDPNDRDDLNQRDGVNQPANRNTHQESDELPTTVSNFASQSPNFYSESQSKDSESVPENFFTSQRFTLLSKLGHGGFGSVYLARDEVLQRNVAIKIPRSDVMLTRPMVQRFHREAQNVAKLDHPNIVPVLATDETGILPTIIYQYCNGPTLAAWLQGKTDKVDPRVAASIVMLLSEAVQHAHTRGILHRDLKPSNIMLERLDNLDRNHSFFDGTVEWIPRVTDFGISKGIQEKDGETVTAAVLGTLEYMSPEQILGRAKDIGSHSDVYSLGVILFELLTQTRPYKGNTGGEILLQMNSKEPPLARNLRNDIPRDLDAIVSRCMNPSIHLRYSTAGDLADDLRNFLDDRPVVARPVSGLVRLHRWTRRQPTVAALSILCAVSIFLGILATVGYFKETRDSVEALSRTNLQLERARKQADSERDRARSMAEVLRNQLYASDIATAAAAIADGDLPRGEKLLERQLPNQTGEDLREIAWSSLWNQSHRDSDTILESNGPLYSVRLSHHNHLAACCGAEGRIHLFDAISFREIRRWDANQSELNCVAFSDDDSVLASAGDDGSICVWGVASGKLLNRFKAHQGMACRILFGPDATMVTCGSEPMIKAWNWRTGELLGTFEGHEKSVASIAWSPGRKELYSGSNDGERIVWNPTTFAKENTFPTVLSRIVDVKSGAEPWLLSADVNGIVRCDTRSPTPQTFEVGHTSDGIEAIAFSPSPRQIALITRAGMIQLIELDESGRPVPTNDSSNKHNKTVQNSWVAHRGRTFDLEFESDGMHLHSVGEDGLWKRWNVERPNKKMEVMLELELPDERMDTVEVDQGSTGTCLFSAGLGLYRWKPSEQHISKLTTIEQSVSRLVSDPAGSRFFTGHRKGVVACWQLDADRCSQTWEYTLQKNSQQITGLAYCPKTQTIAVAVDKPYNAISILNASSGTVVRTVEVPHGMSEDNHGGLALSPDGNWLAAGFGNDTILYDLQTGDSRVLIRHLNTVTCLCFSPDSQSLVTGSDDRSLLIWDTKTGTNKMEMRQHKSQITSVAFTPDGRSILSSDRTGASFIWHALSMQVLVKLDPVNGESVLASNLGGGWIFRRRNHASIVANFIAPNDGSTKTTEFNANSGSRLVPANRPN